MRDKLRIVILSVLAIGCLTAARGQVITNYDSEILIESRDTWSASPEFAKVVIDLDEFAMTDLSVSVPANSSVFIDKVMWFYANSDTTFTISLENLRKGFPSEVKGREFVVYKKGIRLDDVSFKKGRFDQASLELPASENEVLSQSREVSPMEQFFFLAVLVVFMLISLFKLMYPDVLSLILRPDLVFSSEDFSESNTGTKFFTEEVLFFLVIFTMLLMLVFMIGGEYLKMPLLQQIATGDVTYMFFVWLLGTGVLLMITMLKYLWLKVCAFVFGLGKVEFVHFFYMMRVASVILMVIYFSLIICFTNDVMSLSILMNYLLMGFFIIYIFGLVVLFFIMSKNVSLKNYHLFSYLCTAELVPFLVLSKLIIG